MIRGSDVLPLSGLSVPGRRLLSAVVDVAGTGSWLIVDGPALTTVPELVSLASVNTALDGVPLPDFPRATVPADAAGSGEACVTYSAGADIATPLSQVVEILPFPSVITATPGADGVLGIVVHREAAVPVLRLAEMLGRTGEPIGVETCLLLVAVDGESVAFAVDRLRGIEPLSWCDPNHVVPPDTPRSRLLNAARLVQVGTDARMLPELNLMTLALSLQKDARLPG